MPARRALAPPSPPQDLPSEVASWRQRFAEFLAGLGREAELLVLCHSDADGLAAGAILTRRLERAGWRVRALTTGKGGNAWNPDTAARLSALNPPADGLIVCDLGVRAEPIRAAGDVPVFFIDHHRPSGLPSDATARVVSGYGLEPTPTSGLLALWCSDILTTSEGSDGTDPDEDWIAAVSVLSDLGDRAPFGVLPAAKKRYGVGVLREATTLLNAPRRSATGDATPALRALTLAVHPREILDDSAMKKTRAEVSTAYADAKKAAPQFSRDRTVPVAMIRIHTPCQVHPLIAQIWRTRLPKLMVFGVNTGYTPGFVHFSGRCGPPHNLIDFLRAHRPEGADPNSYGNGHDHAAGGALPTAIWNRFVRDLGFGDAMVVGPGTAASENSSSAAPTEQLSLQL